MTRRTFLANSGGVVLAGAASAQVVVEEPRKAAPPPPDIPKPSLPPLCIFSKHLSKLTYSELGPIVREMGFDGVDLTCRPGGHVEPDKAQVDLLRAIETIRGAGVDIPMITTGVASMADNMGRFVIAVAGQLKVPYFKPGYIKYQPDIEASLQQARREYAMMAQLGRAYGIAMGVHNHAGDYVGASLWDTRALIQDLDPRWAGYYFDARHATVEGGGGAWLTAFRMALPRLKMVAAKDFFWEKAGGKWQARNCPLGQGMVDWPKVFDTLASARFTGPISLHIEYAPADEVGAMVRDLEFLRKQVARAYGAS